MTHFLELARKGRMLNCSSGEEAAANVAVVVVSDVPRLDDEAIEGLIEFIRLAKQQPTTAIELIAAEGQK